MSRLVPKFKDNFSEADVKRLRELLGANLEIPAGWEGMADADAIETIRLLGGLSEDDAREYLRVARSPHDDCVFVE